MKVNDTAIDILFLSWLEPSYSRSAVILNSHYLRKFNYEFRKVKTGFSLPISLLSLVLEFRRRKVIYFVCSPCMTISVWLKIFGRKNIYLDAGWPLTDNTFSKNCKLLNFLKRVRIRRIEKLAFKVSNLIFLESEVQAKQVSVDFRIDLKKLVVGYTGFNEIEFEVDAVQPPELLQIPKNSSKTIVLFRGKINEEAGLERIQNLFLHLKNTIFILCSSNLPDTYPDHENLVKISRTISFAEMKYLYEICDVSIGQLGSSTRQSRTIPHKAFESMYFGKAYLSLNQKALSEVFCEGESALLFSNFKELLSKVQSYLSQRENLKEIGLNAKRIYVEKFNQERLSQNRIDTIIKASQEP